MLECEGVVLEAVSTDGPESRDLVIVCSVNLAGIGPQTEPRHVVKFSKKQHAMPRAEHLKIATPEHYRHNFETAEGIHDELEATYREDLRRFLTRHGTTAIAGPDLRHISGQVSYALDHFWMYCTSVKPSSDYDLRKMAERFSAESVTTIREASEFAHELGAAVSSDGSSLGVTLSPFDSVLANVAQLHRIRTVVWVRHGPVHYSDDPQDLVDSMPEPHRAIPVAFIKRRKFEWEREYRFTVQVRGVPQDEVAYLPISAGLRRLTRIDW